MLEVMHQLGVQLPVEGDCSQSHLGTNRVFKAQGWASNSRLRGGQQVKLAKYAARKLKFLGSFTCGADLQSNYLSFCWSRGIMGRENYFQGPN